MMVGGMLEIRTLGTPSITRDGAPFATKNLKAQMLFVYLAIHAGQMFSRSHLQSLFWSNSDAKRGRGSLRRALHNLQGAVPHDVLQLEDQMVGVLDPSQIHLDITAVDHNPTLYQGTFLNGIELSNADGWYEWLESFRDALTLRIIEQLEAVGEQAMLDGEFGAAINCFQRVLLIDGWREPAHRALMNALWQSGDRAAALAQFQRCKEVLADELGAEPSEETRTLVEQIQGDSGAVRHNLPALSQLTQFVGRDDALVRLEAWFAEPAQRLVTLVGLGGVGKTRLAIMLGHRLVEQFAGDVQFVDVAERSDETLARVIARVMGIADGGEISAEDQLLATLKPRNMLLILDNFEPWLESPDAVRLVQRFLHETAHVRLLITSRERLRLRSERVFVVGGLAEGVLLFEQIARRVDPQFAGERAAIDRICTLVEGMPLAIEMAAAWTRALSCQSIAEEIERDLSVLHSQFRDAPERQRSIEAVFEAAWRRLGSAEKQTLAGLTIFEAGFDRAAVRAVLQSSPRILLELLDNMLLQRMDGNRFRLHARLRQFVQTKLDVPTATRLQQRHADHYLRQLADFAPRLGGREDALILAAVFAAFDNVQVAWRTAAANGAASALGNAHRTLFFYLQTRGMNRLAVDLAGAAQAAVTVAEEGEQLRYRLLLATGRAYRQLGRMDSAETDLRNAVQTATRMDNAEYLARALERLGPLLIETGRTDEAVQVLEQATHLYETAVDFPPNQLNTMLWLESVYKLTGRFNDSRQLLEKALRIAEETEHNLARAFVYNSLAISLNDVGEDPARSLALYQDALALFEGFKMARMIAMTRNNIGNLHLQEQRFEAAQREYEAGLEAIAETGDQAGGALLLANLGACACEQGRFTASEQYLQESLATYTTLGDSEQLAMVWSMLSRLAVNRDDRAVAHRKQEALAALQEAIAVGTDREPMLLRVLAEWAVFIAWSEHEIGTAWQLLHYVAEHPLTLYDIRQYARNQLDRLPLVQTVPPAVTGDVASVLATYTAR